MCAVYAHSFMPCSLVQMFFMCVSGLKVFCSTGLFSSLLQLYTLLAQKLCMDCGNIAPDTRVLVVERYRACLHQHRGSLATNMYQGRDWSMQSHDKSCVQRSLCHVWHMPRKVPLFPTGIECLNKQL